MKKKIIDLIQKKETLLRRLNFYFRIFLMHMIFITLFKEKFYLALSILLLSNATHLFDMYLESISKNLLLNMSIKDFLLESSTIITIFIIFLYKGMIGILNSYLLFTLLTSFIALSIMFYIKTKGLFIPKTGKLHLLWAGFMFTSYFYLLSAFFSEIILFFAILLSYFYAVPNFLIYIIRQKKT